MSEAKKPKKEKRQLPLRASGAPVNTQNTRPSALLFGEVKRLEDLEAQNLDAQNPTVSDVRNNKQSDAQNEINRASKQNITGRPTINNLDVQRTNNRASKEQTTGRPNKNTSDVLTSKSEIWTSEQKPRSDAKTSDKTNSDVLNREEQERQRIYERNRNTDRLSLRPNREILRKFKIYCAENDLGMTEFFEISGLKFIDSDVQEKPNSDVLTPLDDRRLKMMFKCKPFVINLYLAYNRIFNELAASDGKNWNARWTPRDDEAAFRYNDLPPAVVELGILQTQIQKGFGTSRIQTFKYYIDEIEKVIHSGASDKMLETILEYHRSIWKGQAKREIDLSFLETK